jgi:enoyl-CoA hydratase
MASADPHDPSGSPLLTEQRGPLLTLRLNRPDRLNAVTLEMYEAIERAIAHAGVDSEVRAVVITGAGRAFCVGADLKAHRNRDRSGPATEYVAAGQRANRALQRCPKPVIAAINGHAIGAGMELALSCDFLVAAEDAKLRFPELGLGTFVGGGTIYSLAQRVGMARARELVLRGNVVLGRDAEAMGLVTQAVAADAVLPTVIELAHELISKAPVPVALAKDLLDRAQRLSFEEVLALEQDALLRCMQTRDWHEGVDAFAERRAPRFTGE